MPKTKTPKPKRAKKKAPPPLSPASNGRVSGDTATEEPAETAELDSSSLAKIFEDAAKTEKGPGLKFVDVECPFCGEDFEIVVDPQEEGQEMVQDCRACCKPITFSVEMEDGELSVSPYRE